MYMKPSWCWFWAIQPGSQKISWFDEFITLFESLDLKTTVEHSQNSYGYVKVNKIGIKRPFN